MNAFSAFCDSEDPMGFDISFYEDDAGQPGNLVKTFSCDINRVETDIIYDEINGHMLYLYRYKFPDPVNMQNGWVSVEGNSQYTPDCLFWWMNSRDGDFSSYEWDGTNLMHLTTDMTFSLEGGWQPTIPENLNANLNDNTGVVDLDWQFNPNDKAFQYFKIYRDGNEIGVSLTEDYTDNLTGYGTYEYYVTAYYDEEESTSSDTAIVTWSDFGIKDLDSKALKIFPNPVKDVLNIESQRPIQSVELFDLLGYMVFEKEVMQKSISFQIAELKNGIYTIRIWLEDGSVVVRKVIVNRE